MTAKEVLERLNNDNEMLYIQKSNGEHLATLIGLGRVIPTHKACAQKVVRHGQIDVLGGRDVRYIERLLNHYGEKGDYQLTKSGRFARLNNAGTYFKVLTFKFSL